MSSIRSLSIAVAASLLGACTTLIPDYQRPAAPVPANWAGQGEPVAAATAVADIDWRDYFADARVRELITMALANNRDLRVSALNIEKARAQYRIQRAGEYPAVNLNGGQNAQRLPGDLTNSGEPRISRQYSATVGIAAWELDFFGRVRSLSDQALETYLGTEEARRSAQISLVAEVVNAWLTLAADRELRDLARDTWQTQQKSVDLTQRSFDAGAVSALDLRQAQSAMERARADAARYAAQVAKDENALELLVGTPVPAALKAHKLVDAVSAIADVPAGVPSEVLVRRPDVLQAERALKAANASIGAARAAFFPRISLTATAGTASSSLDGLFGSGSGTWTFVPQISLPIFNAGSLSASLDVATVQRDIQVAQYEKAVQLAFREVSDALAERATLSDQLDARRKLVEASAESYRLSDARYRNGIDSYLVLLDAQRSRYAAEQELIAVRLSEASNRVALYKVMGGGWQ
ncbi:AdeC/AdeK/OprM family multidrug efflux complex outer membrane factor [Azoarcus sp. L1K30]|uniref:AdeC/AdeK/OprM family multidrug efflux complex outer membrane factor n=1 Tax=Azoarcus sp. L1K30 TaxID=2820277 RepID=UPI001B833F0B|nr:AdeC/AdeK/OprM family multidrug efflux complex outer membrane factor [Azoarcus sp. L1K30]MBR0567682.1 AdeC/AdeK/OprM family multidrug efflux complex outer membrane factor [Azoarcus sp. L1K30]